MAQLRFEGIDDIVFIEKKENDMFEARGCNTSLKIGLRLTHKSEQIYILLIQDQKQ